MANRVVVRGRIRGGGNRRKTAWIASSIPVGVNALASGATSFDQQFVASTAFPNSEVTVVRTRGQLYVQSDQVAAREECFGAMGMIMVRDPAAAVGGASLPGPLTEAFDDGWFVWEPWACSKSSGDGDALVHAASFDSKAQRKFRGGDTIVVMVENSASGFGVEFELNFRMLMMLP